jgi:dihydrofolate reductase
MRTINPNIYIPSTILCKHFEIRDIFDISICFPLKTKLKLLNFSIKTCFSSYSKKIFCSERKEVSVCDDENTRQPSKSRQVMEESCKFSQSKSSLSVKSISQYIIFAKKMTRSDNNSSNLNVIFACTKQNGIGVDQDLPFRIKKDMKYFSTLTSMPNSAVIMGRKTWDSIPEKFRPLKNRLNIVLSRSMRQDNDCILFNDLKEALDHADGMNLWIMGGAQIYNQSFGLAERIFITRVERQDGKEIRCDTFLDLSRLDLEYYQLGDEDVVKVLGKDAIVGLQTEGDYKFEFQIWQKK